MAAQARHSDGDLSLSTRPHPWRRITRPQWIAAAAVAAAAVVLVVAVVAVIKLTSNRAGVAPVEVARGDASHSSGTAGSLGAASSSGTAASSGTESVAAGHSSHSAALFIDGGRGGETLEKSVAKAPVIVVATALDSTPVPATIPGDRPSYLLRWRVERVLKGKLADKTVVVQSRTELGLETSTAPEHFIGKKWIIMLSADYLAGKHRSAHLLNVEFESRVKSWLPKEEKKGIAAEPAPAIKLAAKEPATGRSPEKSLRESLRERPLEELVSEAAVIVVGNALDSAPAAAKRPGDLPENFLRFRVKRVLKGKLADKIVTVRTPTAPGEFLGKDWIVLLSADNLAGKHRYAPLLNVKLEPVVAAALPKDKKGAAAESAPSSKPK
jgi:hypothetical protein